ncbi:hypothetical protein ACHAWF_002573 [Thalassiosira exigua]
MLGRIAGSPLHNNFFRQAPRTTGAGAAAISRTRGLSSCPFQTLGLKRGKRSTQRDPTRREDHSITYDQVRAAFRELALKHHPDTNTSGGSSKEFTRIREAFEAIVEGPDGTAVLRDDGAYVERHDNINENDMYVPGAGRESNCNPFQDEQNGFLHPSVNPQIVHEVAEMAEKMNPGGLDKGGMWHYANMIRNMAKGEGKGLPPLRVDGGDSADAKEGESRIGRRRRRKR